MSNFPKHIESALEALPRKSGELSIQFILLYIAVRAIESRSAELRKIVLLLSQSWRRFLCNEVQSLFESTDVLAGPGRRVSKGAARTRRRKCTQETLAVKIIENSILKIELGSLDEKLQPALPAPSVDPLGIRDHASRDPLAGRAALSESTLWLALDACP